MYAKKNGRTPFRSNRRTHYKKNINLFSNIKPRVKGNTSQLYEKYSKLAKEASSSGDRIQAEYYYQFADHYSRLILEQGLLINDNLENQNSTENKSVDQKSENDDHLNDEIETNKDKEATEEESADHGSIESVSFISQPAKK